MLTNRNEVLGNTNSREEGGEGEQIPPPTSALKKVVKIPLQMQREPIFQARTVSLSKE